jgi:hypothetical protein
MNPTRTLACAAAFLAMTLAAPLASAQTRIDEESPWPRVRSVGGDTVTLFQPQVESWTKNSFSARAAVGVLRAGAKTETLGVVWFTATGSVDRSSRLVTLDRFEITKIRFPDAPENDAAILAILRQVLPSGARTVSLDYLINALGFKEAAARQGARGLKHTPPEIIWATNRTVLVLIDGEPVLRPVPGSSLRRVLNTPALLVNDGAKFYLFGEGQWFAASTLQGPWALVQAPPSGVVALSSGTPPAAAGEATLPRILVRTHPAELLVSDGLPDYRPIRGTTLQYAADTDSQLFYNSTDRQVYLLLSGRWFKADSLFGPWVYVHPADLPGDFAKIPPGTPQAIVLASVPNTREAELALLANSVPTTATVKGQEAKIELAYDGQPQFKPIEGTAMTYAINASLPVILSTGAYYALDNAIWFTAKAATGPWKVATEVPEEIYTIPPESPVFYATFARIYEANDDEVEVGYTPGYLGAYEDEGTVVYGTGWDYDCWCEDEYYGWGWTWGYYYTYVPWYQWWVWRNWWDPPGSLRSAIIENIYDRWQGRPGVIHHDRAANAAAARLSASGTPAFPALYGRFQGSTRPAALVPPANTLALNPYQRPKGQVSPGEIPRGAQLLTTVRQQPGGGRDLYASPDGAVYLRKPDGWYRREAGGAWSFAAPLQGTVTHSQVAAARPGAAAAAAAAANRLTVTPGGGGAQQLRNRAPDQALEARAQEIEALEREYYARSLAQIRAQNIRASGNFDRPSGNVDRSTRRGGGRRR